MDRFFAVLGKLLIGSLLLAGVLTAGYFIGTAKYKKELLPSSSPLPPVEIQKIDAAPTITSKPSSSSGEKMTP
jgi:hypothetical protein